MDFRGKRVRIRVNERGTGGVEELTNEIYHLKRILNWILCVVRRNCAYVTVSILNIKCMTVSSLVCNFCHCVHAVYLYLIWEKLRLHLLWIPHPNIRIEYAFRIIRGTGHLSIYYHSLPLHLQCDSQSPLHSQRHGTSREDRRACKLRLYFLIWSTV